MRWKRSFFTTSRWVSSFVWSSTSRRYAIRSDSAQSARPSASRGTVS